MTGTQRGDRDAEWPALQAAAAQSGLDLAGARLVSSSARTVWHAPAGRAAVCITRPGARSWNQVTNEARAVSAARAAGVRTPPILGGPFELPDVRFALVYEWLDGEPAPTDRAWTEVVTQAARIASARADGLGPLSLHLAVRPERWAEVLGVTFGTSFKTHWTAAAGAVAKLVHDGPLVLCHGDLHPSNVLMDDDGAGWLLDLENACLAPPEWDPAKILILAHRFGEPAAPGPLLTAWPSLDRSRLTACVSAQEVLNVGWLAEMALNGTRGAAVEARRRIEGLHGGGPLWRHLS